VQGGANSLHSQAVRFISQLITSHSFFLNRFFVISFNRSECLREEIVHIPAQGTACSTGEYHEGDRPSAG